jgi:predicted Zn-ribbon and HTH transcriptional regulator
MSVAAGTNSSDPAARETARQRIVELLTREELSFEELRRELDIAGPALEDHLHHVERSVRKTGARLRTDPSRCLACGFVFTSRAPRRFHAPGRCPRCRSERITDPRFRIS